MESANEMMDSGVTIFESETSSNYHVASRTGDFELRGDPMASPVMSEDLKRKKRGRPRKHKANESMNGVFLPVISPSSDLAANGMSSAQLTSSEKNQQDGLGAKEQDDWVESYDGSCFYQQELTFKHGEDICTRIMGLSLQGPQTVCIISGSGFVSNVTVRHPSSSGDSITYKGQFQILSFSGFFTLVKMPNSEFGRSGMMAITMSSADGTISGGIIGGLMIAAGPVKVVVASFVMKPEKQNSETAFTGGEELGCPSNTEVPNCSMPELSESGVSMRMEE